MTTEDLDHSITAQDLVGHYMQHPALEALLAHIGERHCVHLRGLTGSGASLVAQAVIRHSECSHLFILEDREEAAYFFNDLENLKATQNALFFPASYRIPYQEETIDNANVLLRAETLQALNKGNKQQVVVSHPAAIAERVVTRKKLAENTLEIRMNDHFSLDFINEFLLEFGFDRVDYVYEPGQFSIRGGIVDVFSYSSENPYRVEFFDDEVESIRTFDPTNQLSIGKQNEVVIVPNVQDKILHESRESFLEFIPENTCIWIKDAAVVGHRIEKQLEKAVRIYDKLTGETRRLEPKALFLDERSFLQGLQDHPVLEFGGKSTLSDQHIGFRQQPQPSFNKNFDLLAEHLEEKQEQGFRNIIACLNDKQAERLHRIYEDQNKSINFATPELGLFAGFIDHDLQLTCYTDHQIFERYHRYRLKEGFKKNKQALTLKELSSLQPGDFVTHIDHGVGKFSGLEKIDVNGKMQEAIRLEYQGGDILYVSIHSLHRIAKFTGKEGTQPKINKLGSVAWQNLKKKTKRKVKEIAFDLIQLYAKRKAAKGFSYSPDGYLQNELEASFIFEDTPDQLTATQDVKKDMESETPMDRLICGDVGFGKTEIAIRAAFKAVTDGKQVAILVPTTVLCLQHYKSFSRRLKAFPVTIDYISRLKSAKQNSDTLKRLKAGEIDILVGTHKLIGKAVEYRNLGLLVIDEEQKFGVAVKDKLKTLRANLDCLTLTATPIPRTLQFSLMGARDLSIIRTPPPNRYPVHTEIRQYHEEWIRDAVMDEVQRGGQVFFLHNRVQNIKEVAGMLQRICPGVRIGVGHGQLEPKKLEEVMVDFTDGLYDVLVCTTIIESGIDVSNANTIIINNAPNFGLSDLHQLRGRVGRSNKKAFCYLIAPALHHLPADARKRLQAIEQFADLGSGMEIAMRDLDIRGAGDLLGGEQSGFIAEIGFETYHKILNEAIRELKENEFREVFQGESGGETDHFVEECILETDLELVIPDWYVDNITERLNLYKDLDNLQNEEQLRGFEANMTDRFGLLPDVTLELTDTVRLRWLAEDIGFRKLVIKNGKMLGYFVTDEDSRYFQSDRFSKVLAYVQQHPDEVQMKDSKGKFYLLLREVKTVKQALGILQKMSGKVPA